VIRLPNWSLLSPLDWLAISTRWLWLAALLVVAGVRDRLSLPLVLTLLGWAAFSGVAHVLQASPRRSWWLGWVIGLGDVIFSLASIARSGGLSSPLWSGLLIGAMGAGLSYGLVGALAIATVGIIGSALLSLSLARVGVWALVPLGIYVGVLMLGAAVLGQLAERIRWRALALGAAGLDIESLLRERRRVNSVFRMAAELNATLNYERVLDMALELSASALSDYTPEKDHLMGALLLFDGDELRVVSDWRLTHADRRVTLPGEAGVIAQAFTSGAPILIRNPMRDPEIQRLVAFHSCRQLLCIPLAAGLEAYGVLLFGHPRADYFTSDHTELLEAMGQQVMVALQNARLYRDLLQEKERIVKIEEEARRKLARDLHDGPTQSIAAIAMRINFARRLLDRDQKAASSELFKVEDLARRTTKEIRHMLFTLRPLILESQGLVVALRQLAEKLQETHGQNVVVEGKPDVAEGLEMGKQGVIFYIAEEAVNNAGKHAQAEHVWVRLRTEEDLFVLEVEDDGVGFNVGAVDTQYTQRGSLGMVNMRERAELINGVLRIQSLEGHGTKITVYVPLTEEGAEKLHKPGFAA